MHNLGTVFKFEFLRTIKKPSFWIVALLTPVIMGGFMTLSYFSSQNAVQSVKKMAEERFSFEIYDQSGVLNQSIVEQFGGKISDNAEKSFEKMKAGKINAFYSIPKDLTKDKIQISANDTNITTSGKFTAVLEALMKAAATESIDTNKIAILNDAVSLETKLYKDGKEFNPIAQAIIPGVFLVVFYVIVGFFSNRMLTSTTEEKENRVTEMILTSISAKTLIIGKILSLVALAFLQIVLMIVPLVVALLVAKFGFNTELANLSFLSNIEWNPERIAIGALVLISGLAMTIGAIVALGAAMPTAQEAANYFGVIVILLMAPFFVMNSFIMGEKSFIVDFLSYFPPTSPIALLLRNALGTLSLNEALIGVGALAIFAAIAVWAAVRIFQFGTISYGAKVNLKNLFAKKA